MKKCIVAILFSCLLLNTVSCNGQAEPDTSSDVTDVSEQTSSETELLYPEYTLDRAGADFNMYFFDPIAAGGWSSEIPCDIDQPELTGESLSDAIYTRNRKVEELYNTKIIACPKPDYDMVTPVQQSVLSDSGTYDVVMPTGEFMSPMITNHYVIPLPDSLDTTSPWWNADSAKAFTVTGKRYAVTGDYTYFDKLCDTIIMFNKQIVDDHNLGNLYQLVLDYEWTFETMLSMAESVSYDADENGNYDAADHYGFSGQNDGAYQLFHSGGEVYCSINEEGEYVFTAGEERAVTLLQEIFTFMNTPSQYFNRQSFGLKINDVVTMFQENRVLFFMRPMQTLFELRSMDADFGIIPTPLMDENQDQYYTSIMHTAAVATSIPADIRDAEAAVIILDTLAAESYYTVSDVLYELILGNKVVRDSESVQNLDIIFSSHIYDPGCIFNFGDFSGKMLYQWKSPDTVSSVIQSSLVTIETDIEKLMDAVN